MDWLKFFDERHIPYVLHGPNVAKGNCNIKCCWCGDADPSEHLSINLEGKGFRCWRDRSHSGKNPAKLIQALLKCSWEQANQLAGNEKTLPSDFMAKMKGTLMAQEVEKPTTKLRLPAEFKPLSNTYPSAKPYIAYLRSRGFNDIDIFRSVDYGIRYSSLGDYKGRIIFTVTFEGELVGWTGRTIWNDEVRYKTLSDNAEKYDIPAPRPISDYLLFYDMLESSNADTIVLCEGPFDAWRINLLGKTIGVAGTCFFTSMLSTQQMILLHDLLPKFENRILLLDQETFSKSQKIKADLSVFDVQIKRLPQEIKDPAEILSAKTLQKVLFG